MAKGYITPAMNDWATALCAQNEAAFDAFISKAPAAYSHLSETSHTARVAPSHTASLAAERADDAASVCRQLGLETSSLD